MSEAECLPPALDDLPAVLRPDHLYLFVMGPGTGESTVLRLPGGKWVLVDCCRPRQAVLPLVAVLRRYHARRLGALVLTHPHRDHYPGMKELLDELEGVDAVGFLGSWGNPRVALDPPLTPFAHNDAALRLSLRGCAATIRRLEDTILAGARGINLIAGSTVLDEGAGGARLHCLSPGRAQVEELVGAPGWPDQVPDLANRLSAVLRLDWGSSFWILGADLESSGGKPCWEDLPPLHDHAGLKIPHHGSKGAHSARWADSDGVRQPRLWALTPFNGASLPRFDEPSGLPALLGRQSPILVTSLPSAYLKTIQGRTLQCSEVVPRRERTFASEQPTGLDRMRPVVLDHNPPEDCLVGACFDSTGRCIERYCRHGALEILA